MNRRICQTALVVLLGFLLNWSTDTSAWAAPNVVGILDIQTRGVSKVVAEQFETEIEEALEGVGMRAVDRETLQRRLLDSEYLEGCFYGPCLAAVRAATGVPLVMTARFEGEGSNYTFVITLIDSRTGMFTSQVAQTCPVCTVEEAISTATLATISLLTGTGEAEVSEFSSSAAATNDLRSYHRSRPMQSSLRKSGLLFVGAGILSGVLGALYWSKNPKEVAWIGAGAGTALIVSGTTMLVLSRRF